MTKKQARTLSICLALLPVASGFRAPAAAGAENVRAWQGMKHPLNPKTDLLVGLDLMVSLDGKSGWPRLMRDLQIDAGRHTEFNFTDDINPHASRYFSPIDFGVIRPLGGEAPEIEDFFRDWSASGLVLRYEPAKEDMAFMLDSEEEAIMSVVASRLAPGVLIRMKSDIELFGGGQYLGTTMPGADPKATSVLACRRKGVGFVPPEYYAAGDGGGRAVVKTIEEISALPVEALERGWLLAWYGEKSFFKGVTQANLNVSYTFDGPPLWNRYAFPADCPLLILFSSSPDEIVPGSMALDSLHIRFNADALSLVILPLLGEYMPPAMETEKWRAGLPEKIIERCDWWAAHMKGYPLGVREEYRYDRSGDTIAIVERFSFEAFRAYGEYAAPVPPIMATAALEGFPITFSTQPHDPGLVTSVGSFLAVPGVESYEMRFAGFGKYALPRPPPQGPAPAELVARINQEVEKIVSAGHLAPWMCPTKSTWGSGFVFGTQHLIHANPGETLYFLSEALPFLDEELKQRTIEHMRTERETYPPERVGLLQGGNGNRRESYELSSEFLRDHPGPGAAVDVNNINCWRFNNFFVRNNLVPPETLYHLAAFYGAAGNDGLAANWGAIQAILSPYLERMDWATGANWRWPNTILFSTRWNQPTRYNTDRWYGQGGVVDINNLFAAAIGQVRMARILGAAEAEATAWGLFARTAALRFTAGKLLGHFYKHGLLTTDDGEDRPRWLPASPEQDLRLPVFLDEYGAFFAAKSAIYGPNGLLPLRDIVPELSVFMGDFLRPETERFLRAYQAAIPTWYLAWDECTMGDECNIPRPQDAYQVFMAHALLFDSPPEWLEQHLDIPWHPRGDLYYLQKLVETARAYAWKNK